MSGPSGAGAPPPANSVLSFVASAQPLQPEPEPGNLQETNRDEAQTDRLMPAGLKALCDACSKLYPDQPNPLQVTTRLKYWLGGEDPLDYISMYWNPGNTDEHIPPHWHYISFGLSDLHGDGRVHAPGRESGFGAELTFRVASEEATPPLWPAALCQHLARYVFTTGNKFCPGDHISWHRPLDGSQSCRGRVRHLLVARDPALRPVTTPYGRVDFLQIVGCTSRELKAAQRGSGNEVLKQMADDPTVCGKMLVTRMCRRRSVRSVATRVATRVATLAGVTARVRWVPVSVQETSKLPSVVEQEIKDTLQRGLTAMTTETSTTVSGGGQMSTDSFEMSSIERALPDIGENMMGSWRDDSVQYFDGVHIFMNPEAASLLPLALDGRVRCGAHFTWRGACTRVAVSVAARDVTGALPTTRVPYAARGGWLQVLLEDEEAKELSSKVSAFAQFCQSDSETDEDNDKPTPPRLPVTVTSRAMHITVLPDDIFL